VPPKINFVSADPVMMTGFRPAFMPVSPFVEIAAMQAQMDRQMAAMEMQARQLQAAAMRDPLSSAPLNGQASADNGMRFVAIAPGSSYCFRSVAITASPHGGAPKIVSHSEGNCGATPSPQKPAVDTAPAVESAAPLQAISYKALVASHPRPGI
jgi:Tfp pilus assembly protein PilE